MISVLLAGGLSGCLIETTEISRLKQNDVFIQEPSAEVDILWVVDNSPSMSEEQQQEATATLQAIDANFVRAHEAASQLLSQSKAFTQNMERVHGSLKVRRPRRPSAAAAAAVCR